MNSAIFISEVKNPEAEQAFCSIKNAETRLRNLVNDLEIRVGELEIGEDGIVITVSEERFRKIRREMSECTEKIRDGYEKLRELSLARIY